MLPALGTRQILKSTGCRQAAHAAQLATWHLFRVAIWYVYVCCLFYCLNISPFLFWQAPKKSKKNKGVKKRERQSARHSAERMFPIPAPAFDPFTQSSVTIEELPDTDDDAEPPMAGGSSASTDLPNPVVEVAESEGSQTDISNITGDVLLEGMLLVAQWH